MSKRLITGSVKILFFVVVGFLILWEQYINYGVWFQVGDIHHETFALASFALAIGILVGLRARD